MRVFNGPWDPPTAWQHGAVYRQHMPPDDEVRCIVEIGVHFGFSLFTFARDYPDAMVIGIDNFSFHDSDEARAHLEKHCPSFPNVKILDGNSKDIAGGWRHPEVYTDIDMLHIDGDHSYDGCRRDFYLWSQFVLPGGIILFHDVNSFPDDVGKLMSEIDGQLIDDQGPGLGVWRKDYA